MADNPKLLKDINLKMICCCFIKRLRFVALRNIILLSRKLQLSVFLKFLCNITFLRLIIKLFFAHGGLFFLQIN